MLHAVCSICSVQYEVCSMLCAEDVCSMKCAVWSVQYAVCRVHSEVFVYRRTWSKYACLFQLPCAAILILVPLWCHYRSAWGQQLVLQPTLVRQFQPAYVLLLVTTNYCWYIRHITKTYERFYWTKVSSLAYTRPYGRCSNSRLVCMCPLRVSRNQ